MKPPRPQLSRWQKLSGLGKAVVLAAAFFGLLGVVEVALDVKKLRRPAVPVAASVATGQVTLTTYAYLTPGLLYTQASELLGGPGVLVSARDSGGVHAVVYKWGGPNGAFMQAVFQNDRLVRKTEVGLQ
ncbi:hypothetical protein HHL22_02980 [Hymenobacter sp. RP-2-7]|uniref:Uncharacterized protein n=1 Tax=Hymenobacter polaris TaxID=2682546 RepID=A0A7Y0ABS7_9BACT|nr:hypothetical protein [Hymenobacter polaris]NML64160.1 hypothetical protein [Hymenobacter polaris]